MSVYYLRKAYSLIIRSFYPNFCGFCSNLITQNDIFCPKCDLKIQPIASSYLQLTKTKKIKVLAASGYKEPLKNLILKKHGFGGLFASKQLGDIICHKTDIKNLNFDFIIPVPLHWTRFAKRGYNQSFEIAKILGKKLNKPVLSILKRSRKTNYQANYSFDDRQKNVENAFKLKRYCHTKEIKKMLEGKDILLVDDLCTTGATLKNVAGTLLKFKPNSIKSVVACRVI